MSTIQLDFQLPQRFGLEYVGADNARHRPVMIHRALFGSVERFFAILLEHYAGALPTWLLPEQVRVLPVSDDARGLRRAGWRPSWPRRGLRVELADADEPLGAPDPHGPSCRRSPTSWWWGTTTSPRGRSGSTAGGRPAPSGACRSAAFAERGDGRGRRPGLTRGRPGRRRQPLAAGRRVPLEQLWAGWRHEYVVGRHRGRPGRRRAARRVRVLPRSPPAGRRRVDNGVVWRGEQSFAVLNAYPYASGHLLVLPDPPRGRARPSSDRRESAELWETTRRGRGRARRRPTRPDGVNLGANLGRAAGAGIPATSTSTSCPAGPGDTNFMTAVAGVRVMPETLADAWRSSRGLAHD